MSKAMSIAIKRMTYRPPYLIWREKVARRDADHRAAERYQHTKDSAGMTQIMGNFIRSRGGNGFYLFRVVCVDPGVVVKAVGNLKRAQPELNVEVLGGRTSFQLYKQSLGS